MVTVFISVLTMENGVAVNNGLSGFAYYAKKFVSSGDTIFYATDGGGVYYLQVVQIRGSLIIKIFLQV